jgi:RNA polymerase sigma-70 factor (ECF subfamily)
MNTVNSSSRSKAIAPPDGASEHQLLTRAAAGDGAAFGALMRRHNQLLFRTARSMLASDAEAEDAVQEAYLRAWRALASFRADSKLATWLVRIVTNEALGRLRRRSADIIPLEAALISTDSDTQAALTEAPDREPEQSALRGQLRKIMEARIDQLPDSFRMVFMLRAVEEMSVEDVAASLDIPEATVRTRFFRARSLLREGLASEMDTALGEIFSFDGARCDRIVASVLRSARAERLCNDLS